MSSPTDRSPVILFRPFHRCRNKFAVLSWLREEGYVGAVERLRQLCLAGGSCCKAALILSESLLTVDAHPPPPFVKKIAVDAYLVLLLRAGKTKECLSHVSFFFFYLFCVPFFSATFLFYFLSV